MFQERCYLCGGKLLNGRCQECGLDNHKNIERNYRLNGSRIRGSVNEQIDGESDWQTRDIERKTARRNVVNEKAGNAKLKASQRVTSKPVETTSLHHHTANEDNYTANRSSGAAYKLNSSNSVKRTLGTQKKGMAIGGIVTIIIALIGIAPEFVSHIKESFFTSSIEAAADPYEYVTRELSTTGEEFEIELEPGSYQVGVHIPEGEYILTLKEGNGSAYISDSENSIYQTWYFGSNADNDEIQVFEGARFYEGAMLEVSGNMKLSAVTDNGQNDKMTSMENPLKEKVLILKDETLVAGTDFLAGVYDLHSITSWSGISYKVPLHTDFEEEELNFRNESKWVSERGLDSIFRNIVLPEGTEILTSEADVELVPSAVIRDEDYDAYYMY